MSHLFFESIRAGDVDDLRSLIEESPALIRSVIPEGEGGDGTGGGTGLHLAVHFGTPEIVGLLIDLGVDLEARNNYGRTALHDSIEYGQHEIQSILLERGATIDVFAAAILGMLERVRELLDREPALVNDRSTNLSPLGWAAFGNQVDVASELISRGARMEDGELLCAASVGHVEVGRLLLEHGADPNEIDGEAGGNALHAAASMRYTSDSSAFISMLLAAGANPGIRSKKGQTALQIAEAGARRQCSSKPDGGSQGLLKNYEVIVELLKTLEGEANE